MNQGSFAKILIIVNKFTAFVSPYFLIQHQQNPHERYTNFMFPASV